MLLFNHGYNSSDLIIEGFFYLFILEGNEELLTQFSFSLQWAFNQFIYCIYTVVYCTYFIYKSEEKILIFLVRMGRLGWSSNFVFIRLFTFLTNINICYRFDLLATVSPHEVNSRVWGPEKLPGCAVVCYKLGLFLVLTGKRMGAREVAWLCCCLLQVGAVFSSDW